MSKTVNPSFEPNNPTENVTNATHLPSERRFGHYDVELE